MWGVSKISINTWDIRPNSIVIAICQTTLTFGWKSDLAVWLFVASYEAWSAKNREQVYGCKVYLKLYFLASLANFKYSSSGQFKLLVSVSPSCFDWIGLGALALVTLIERRPWARGQQWPSGPGWERQLLPLAQLDLGKDICPVTELALLLHTNELEVIRVLSLKTS